MTKLLELPTFRRSRCVLMNVCGSIETNDKDLLNLLGEKKNTLIATYDSSQPKSQVYAALITGGHPEVKRGGKHFHLDVIKKSIFGKNDPPNPNSSVEEIEERYGKFSGLDIEASVLGMFEVNLSSLPENGVIRSNMFETEEEGLKIKISASEYRIEGAPISRVFWAIDNRGKKMRVQMETHIKATIDKSLINSLNDTMNEFFNVFVLENK